MKKIFPQALVIGGNIASAKAAIALADACADGIKVSIATGSICTTRIVAGVGVPHISAVANVAEAIAERGVPDIADGGVRFSGDLAKAFVAGTSPIMCASMWAATDKAPGEVQLFPGRAFNISVIWILYVRSDSIVPLPRDISKKPAKGIKKLSPHMP